MRILNLDFNTDIYTILDDLRDELHMSGSNLLSLDPRESGDYLLIQCPYHKMGLERHPSAQLKKSDGWFYCHNCKESHTLPDFISYCLDTNGKEWLINHYQAAAIGERRLRIDFGAGRRKKQEKPQYISKETLKQYRFTHPYMFERKLTLDVIKKFDIGYDKDFVMVTRDKDGGVIKETHIGECITFPNKDPFGNILFIARRAIHTKFFNYPQKVDKPIYGLYEINREIQKGNKINRVYVCESMLDALVIWSWGKYAIALNGTGSAYQYELLKNTSFRMFILATDNDSAGKKAREKFRQAIKNKFIKEIDYKSYGTCKDINDMTEEQFLTANII